MADKIAMEKRIKELEIVNSELKSLRKGAAVYKQQPNSGIFFRENKSDVFSIAKKELDALVSEYKDIEKSSIDIDNTNSK